jgi:excisionase family DNA binding protein
VATKTILNVRETARILGVHENTVRNWQEKGLLHAVRLPGSGFRRFDREQVERLRDEMWGQLAPAAEGPVTEPPHEPRGQFLFSDQDEG